MKSLLRSSALQTALKQGPYDDVALVPACPWLDAKPPAKPKLTVSAEATAARASWTPAPGDPIGFWLLQVKRGTAWTSEITSERSRRLAGPLPDAVAVTAVDRAGNASAPTVVQLKR